MRFYTWIALFILGMLQASSALAEQIIPEADSKEQHVSKPGSAGQGQPWTGRLADGTVITEKDLKNLLNEHEKWVESRGEAGKLLDLSNAELSGAALSGANLIIAHLSGVHLSGAALSGADLSGAHLQNADFTGANLSMAGLLKADLSSADLSRANLLGANLFVANLNKANLYRADLSLANLSGADLSLANLSGANLFVTNLYRANLYRSNLSGARLTNTICYYIKYEGIVGIPSKEYLSGIRGVETFTYTDQDGYVSLVLLRNILKEIGLRETERQATYAIESGKLTHMSWNNLENWLEKVFRTVLFLWPCAFGLSPGRPLWILVCLIPLFSIFYYLSIRRQHDKGGIYRIWQAERLPKYSGAKEPERLSATGLAAVRWAVYFSILSACRIGWRELNPGSWIVNMQRGEYLLKATDWVRTVSGIQALTSVYLLALAVLTYFGRPFE